MKIQSFKAVKEQIIPQRLRLPLSVFIFTSFILAMVHSKVENPMLLLERFLEGGGWIEIFLIGCYGALVAYHMQDPARGQEWRKYTWFAFSVFFFLQLAPGLLGAEIYPASPGGCRRYCTVRFTVPSAPL